MGAQVQRWLQFDTIAKLEFGIEVQSRKKLIHTYYQPFSILFLSLFLIIKEFSPYLKTVSQKLNELINFIYD